MGAVQYIEVQPYPESYGGEKDLTVNAEAAQSTLQDIKLPESAGGYAYQESCFLSTPTSNRYIYWRASNEILELIEVSLDVNLTGSHIRLRFQHTPVLEGVSIHETHDQVIILVATISSVHRLVFPHPRKLIGTDYLSFHPSEATLPSIFFDASLATLQDSKNHYVLNHAASVGVPLPHTSCSWLTPQKDAIFVLANSIGTLLVVCLPQDKEKVIAFELKQTSVMSRIISGLVPSVIRGNQVREDMAYSLVCHPFNGDTLIFALCKDFRIRMWSYQRRECLMDANVLECCGDRIINTPLNLTAQQFSMKKVSGYRDQDFFLAVYMSLPEQNQFFIFQSRIFSGQCNLAYISTLYAPEYDLVDFHLTDSQLWTLWLNGNSEPIVKFTFIDSEENQCKDVSWTLVHLQTPVAKEVFLSLNHMDPREAYLQEIFKQGRFSVSTIRKAISIYRRIADTSIASDYQSSLTTLKEEVTLAVETEIHSRASEGELTDEEFIDLQMECWHKFFSYCLQYHEVGIKPLGLFLDSKSGFIVIIKKNIFTMLRQCDPLEHLMLSNVTECRPVEFFENSLISEDPSVCSSVLVILDCIDFVHKNISDELWADFDHDMFHQHPPDLIAQDIVRNVLAFTGDYNIVFMHSLEKKLQSDTIPYLIQSLMVLLKGLDLTAVKHVDELLMVEDTTPHPEYNILFSSATGIGIICETVHQVAKMRYNFSRDLLILELLILELGETCGLSVEKAEQLNSDLIPLTSMLTQAYFVMKWTTECYISPVQPNLIESGMQQLSLLDMSENPDISSRSKKSTFIPGSLVHLFLREQGGIQVRQLLGLLQPAEDRMQSAWNNLLPSLVNIVAQLIWPNGMNFLFPEFLLVQCQYLPLQEYVRLLQHWCEWNTCSYQFLVANCHLCLGEPQKAFDLFCQAAEGINNELFLHNKLIQGIEQTSSSSLIVQYYLKVIQLFEFFKQPEYIILLADTAINVIEPEDPSIPVFWSLIFKYHLELNHNEEAYTAMIGNPDPIRRKDSLRQFIVVLCERRELQSLIEFSYADLKNDVVNILESRARSTDLLTQNYYSILYAFHIHNNNFRKAASIMYEHALRLSREVFGRESLVKQAQCYLAVLNCLRLIDQQYAWIVKPIPTVTDNKDEPINVSPKRNFDGERIPQSGTTKMEVLEIEDIKHEYDLVHARLKLLQNDSSPTNIAASLLSPGETVTLLVNSGFYDAAIHICQSFNLSYVPVFDGIAEKCLELMHQYNQQVLCEAWEWLGENELPSVQTMSADKYLWYLLKYYLNKYEKSNQSIYHRCVVSKLLAEGSHLPIWLKLSYQRRNCPELLWLYISCDMLEDATQLAIEYIDAVRGIGKEYFGLKSALHGMKPPVWLPYTLLDMLLNSLEENQEDEVYNELCQKLKDKLCEYQAELGYASKATVELSSRNSL
ncbi:nuclear pore complex protein Nup160 [Centruroides vittatus]|uniref:nuclear pore complex protein Nup160 n=1 Tax=Centruroides vittatus TaxID=120091 RepID=UPI00350FAE25